MTWIRLMRQVVSVSAVLAVLAGCSNAGSDLAATPSPMESADPPTALQTVAPDEAATMTIADVLRSDQRFTRFRGIVERTETPVAGSILAVWDWSAGRMGADRDGVTVFVPTDEAFEALDPAILTAIDDPSVENELLYSLFAHHYVHRLYPSDQFVAGPQRTWRSGPVELDLDPPTWGGHPIVQTDLRTANGIIHVINGVVVPDELTARAAADA